MVGPQAFLVSLTGHDAPGKIAAITGVLFEIGANLCDSAFNQLGAGYEFSAITEFPHGMDRDDICTALRSLDELADCDIRIVALSFAAGREGEYRASHNISFSGGDRPGLVARISEVLADHGANILRMTSQRVKESTGFDYRTYFEVEIPSENQRKLEAAIYNTAGSLRLDCQFEPLKNPAI